MLLIRLRDARPFRFLAMEGLTSEGDIRNRLETAAAGIEKILAQAAFFVNLILT